MTDTTTETKEEHARLHREAGKCAAEVTPYDSYFSHLCDRKGTPEPATRKQFKWATRAIEDVPNVSSWTGVRLEGQLYCKQHSPAGCAQKNAERDLARWEAEHARRRRRVLCANSTFTGAGLTHLPGAC